MKFLFRNILNRYRIILFFSLFAITAVESAYAQSRENIVKAAYIEKFARFTEWPANTFNESFNITILGKDPIEAALLDLFSQYKIKNLPVKITHIETIDELTDCNILIISRAKKNELAGILETVKDKPVLTIGSTKTYGMRGVHFNFFLTEKGTVHFEINPKQIKQAGLAVDMYLLELGKIVGE